MSSLLAFNRVYRLEIQSVMLAFSTGFVNYCLSNLLSGVIKYTVLYARIQCVRVVVWVIGGEGPLSISLIFLQYRCNFTDL
jgi:hypothetical protein